MSRYKADEIANLSKAILLGYVKRQPEVVFPTKICSRPIEHMDKKHLIRALTGNYGYISALVAPPSPASEALSCASDSAEDPIDLVRSGSLAPFSGQQDDRVDEVCSALVAAVRLVDPTPLSNSSLEGVNTNDRAGDSQLGLMQLDGLQHDAEQIVSEAIYLVGVASPALHSSWAPHEDSTTTEFLSAVAPEPVDQTSSAVSTLPALSSSPTHTGHLIAWYDVDEKSDEDLLDAYFRQNPRLVEQLSYMKSHRRKRQTDVSLVRDYKFSLEVYKLLMERRWENESGHILSGSILKRIGLSAPWLTTARQVTQILEKIGPASPNPDPLVMQRLSSEATIHKGKDFLSFLKARANAAGIQ